MNSNTDNFEKLPYYDNNWPQGKASNKSVTNTSETSTDELDAKCTQLEQEIAMLNDKYSYFLKNMK